MAASEPTNTAQSYYHWPVNETMTVSSASFSASCIIEYETPTMLPNPVSDRRYKGTRKARQLFDCIDDSIAVTDGHQTEQKSHQTSMEFQPPNRTRTEPSTSSEWQGCDSIHIFYSSSESFSVGKKAWNM